MIHCKWLAIGWLGLWVLGAGSQLNGQDPFAPRGAAPPPAATQAPPAATALNPDDARNPANAMIIRQLQSSEPSTAAELMRAIRVLMDIDEIEFARPYLDRVAQMQLEDSEWFRVSEVIGPDFLMRLYGESRLAPTSKEVVRTINQASYRYANSEQRVARLIRDLSDPSPAVRSSSARQLTRLEQKGAVALLHVFADETRSDEFPAVRQTLRQMGPTAVGPLLAASRGGPLQMRYEALMALALRVSPECFDAAIGALFSPATPAAIKEDLEWAFQQTYQHLPEQEKALARMRERTQNLLFGRQQTADWLYHDRGAVYVRAWYWNAESSRLEAMTVTPETAARMLALDRATDLHGILPEDAEARRLHLLAFLEAHKRIIGPDRVFSLNRATQRFPDLSAAEIESLLQTALDREMIPAAAAACELLGQHPDTRAMMSANAGTSGLIRALQCGDRHAQFSAFRALAELDFRQPFPGSSQVMAAAVYFATFADRPSGLIGHHHAEIAQSFADVLRQAGISGRGVSSSREFLREAISDANLRYLFLSDTLVGPGYNETLQQLRADWRTKRLPAAILVRNDTLANARVRTTTDPFTLVLPETLDPTLVALQVDQLRRLQVPWEVTTTQGRLQAEYALDWILKILEHWEEYSFYDVLAHERAISDLLYWPHNSQRVIAALGYMGTASAQRTLIEYASQPGLPMENRQLAAENFAKAIARRGTLLTRGEILRQYERYNASAGDTGENQRLLGLLLDIMENHAKRR